MDVVIADALQSHLKYQLLIVDYTFIAGAALLVYDYLLTFHLEVRLIWLAPWNYTKVLFLLTRYIPLVNIFFFLQHQLILNVDLTTCTRTAPVVIWLTLLGILCAEAILLIRTWAVWNRALMVGIPLLTIFVGSGMFALVSGGMFLNSLTYGPPPYAGYRGCNIIAVSGTLWPEYTALAASDGAASVFMIISAIRAYRLGDNGELIHVVHRDGIAFYALVLLCSIGSAIIARAGPPDLMNVLTPLQTAVHSIIASRIVFNVRRVAQRRGSAGSMIGLHSEYREMGVFLTPLARYYLYDDMEGSYNNAMHDGEFTSA